jgi:hypothetical protein
MVRLHFTAPYRHCIVDVKVASAPATANVPQIGARLPLPGSLAMEAHQGKLGTDLRTSALLDTPSVRSVHDYYPLLRSRGWVLIGAYGG